LGGELGNLHWFTERTLDEKEKGGLKMVHLWMKLTLSKIALIYLFIYLFIFLLLLIRINTSASIYLFRYGNIIRFFVFCFLFF
ncbi:MAG: hypothetical protein N7Q72_01795, partial [Spiroplasma sp. Tabriz.8]|nr:hypothetical protein [Spiroplasma sp. Tabriz.8]